MNVAIVSLLAALALASAPAWAQGAAPTDPQIAAIVVAANQVDIDAGKYAKAHAKNKEVRAFANTMITDHTGVNKQASALVKKLHVKPEANPTSESLVEGGKQNLAQSEGPRGRGRSTVPTSTTRSRIIRTCSTRSTRRSSPTRRTPS